MGQGVLAWYHVINVGPMIGSELTTYRTSYLYHYILLIMSYLSEWGNFSLYICSKGSTFPQRGLMGNVCDVTLTMASQSSAD